MPYPESEASVAKTVGLHSASRLELNIMVMADMIQHSYRQESHKRVRVRYRSRTKVYKALGTLRPDRLYKLAAT